jgi:hypothetical protein
MAKHKRLISKALIFVCAVVAGVPVLGQTHGILRGEVRDQLGALVSGGVVTLTRTGVANRTASTDPVGAFAFNNLPSGTYSIKLTAKGFADYVNDEVVFTAGQTQPLNIVLTATVKSASLEVNPSSTLSVDSGNDRTGLVLRGRDLDVLPDDPEQMSAVLQALAGPSAGPNGGIITVDGFTASGPLPTRQNIREVRINQNPFSAENAIMGGRIEVLTTSASRAYHGGASFIFNDRFLNARNPYADNQPEFHFRAYGFDINGPIVRDKLSFLASINRREIDDNSIINATVLDANLNPVLFSEAVVNPRRFFDASLRADYIINKNNNLSVRYLHSLSDFDDVGAGGFFLPSTAYDMDTRQHTVQLIESAIFGTNTVNEFRFQYIRASTGRNSDAEEPNLRVLEAFVGGGSQVGVTANRANRFEVQNITTRVFGKHTIKFGGRFRSAGIDESTTSNFNGTYTFAGGLAPRLDAKNNPILDENGDVALIDIPSLERYRRTLLLQQQGFTADEIFARGGGARQLTIAGGNPLADVNQYDFGGFILDDWRIRPDFMLSVGLRYEAQNQVSTNYDFAPRVAFAWAPRGGQSRSPRTVIRGGAGVFYDRVSETLTLQSTRFNGQNQLQFVVNDPDILGLFPNIPSIDLLARFQNNSVWQLAGDIRTPFALQFGASVERQMPWRTILSVGYVGTHTIHNLRARNINAPLPDTFDPTDPSSGTRPFGDVGNIFQYESSGVFNRHQLVATASGRPRPNISFFSTYALSTVKSDTEGPSGFPANTYDLRTEYARAAGDNRHWFVAGTTIDAWWKFRFSPLFVAWSGGAFNITTGLDENGDSVFSDRPTFATDLTRPSVRITPLGAFDLDPLPGQQPVPRNFGDASGYSAINARLERSFGFGKAPAPAPGRPAGDRPYNLTLGISVVNLLNKNNPGAPIGNLSSLFFGRSNTLLAGRPTASGGNAVAFNRRFDLSVRLTF